MGEQLTWAQIQDQRTNTVYTGSDEPSMREIIAANPVGYTDKTPEEQGVPLATWEIWSETEPGEEILTMPEDCTVNLRRLARSLHHLTHPVEDK